MKMRLILFGPPGAGKGTQSAFLMEHFKIPQISMGDLLRNAVSEDGALGKEVKSYMDKGELVPDNLIIDIIKKRLNSSDCVNGFILDGFPRNIVQADALDGLLNSFKITLDCALEIKISFEDLLMRLLNRRNCKKCQAVYHLIFQPPKIIDKCDKCGRELYQRDDDKQDVIEKRFLIYKQETEPLCDYYSQRGLLKTIDGCGSAEEITQEILFALGAKPSVW